MCTLIAKFLNVILVIILGLIFSFIICGLFLVVLNLLIQVLFNYNFITSVLHPMFA